MPAQRKPVDAKKRGKRPTDSRWARLTWHDLESWAGSRSVSRGRSYQRGGRVKNLAVTGDGQLLATVVGGDYYAVQVGLKAGGGKVPLESTCTCPVGYHGCKHAVAVVAEYLEALAARRDVPAAADDDPRWNQLENRAAGMDDDEDEDEGDWEDDDEEVEVSHITRPRAARRPAPRAQAAVNWDEKIQREIRAKSREELAELVWSLTQRFPELYQEFRERIALREGDVTRLVAEARAEIRKVTSESAWRSGRTGEGHTPDYSRIRRRFERLLELGNADEVVALGRGLIEQGLRQVGQSDDEGETAQALGRCLPLVFQAVTRSSLNVPERLLFAIDAELADDYGVVDDAVATVLDATFPAEDWSKVADTLLERLKAMPVAAKGADGDYSRKYHRDRVTNQAAEALVEAGREGELPALYESEARATGSYDRLIKFLIEHRRYDDAERWTREGIAAVEPIYAGTKANLLRTLGEIAEKRKQWDVVAAHAAYNFFGNPSRSGFDELIEAAGKAKAEEPVRAAALRFLETGARPYELTSPPRAEWSPRTAPASSSKRTASKGKTSPRHEMTPEPPARLRIDRSWPLPVPDYLVPFLEDRARFGTGTHPHLNVLLDMAIGAKQPEEVLRWYEKLRGSKSHPYHGVDANRVAEAVVATHPERALAIYREALEGHLPNANLSAYESAVGYLRKMRPIYDKLNRKGEWSALIASIRESYRNRPRFMELLDGLEGRTIIQSVRPGKK